jgi:hypothetical protein
MLINEKDTLFLVYSYFCAIVFLFLILKTYFPLFLWLHVVSITNADRSELTGNRKGCTNMNILAFYIASLRIHKGERIRAAEIRQEYSHDHRVLV